MRHLCIGDFFGGLTTAFTRRTTDARDEAAAACAPELGALRDVALAALDEAADVLGRPGLRAAYARALGGGAARA